MSLVPAGFLDSLPDELFPDTVTFQESDAGEAYANVSGLVDLQARLQHSSPVNEQLQQHSEDDFDFALQRGASHSVLLRSYQPTVAVGMRLVCSGAYYQVLSIRHPNKTMTVIALSGTRAVV